ncbi:unnamed protein product [Leptosia nina]|uniref:Uncharacterized protein n=1 Tax=Leptosia nina TaxID=320188 RepID=A0AAV1K033_9NEOP
MEVIRPPDRRVGAYVNTHPGYVTGPANCGTTESARELSQRRKRSGRRSEPPQRPRRAIFTRTWAREPRAINAAVVNERPREAAVH